MVSPKKVQKRWNWSANPFGLLGLALILMWSIELLDTFLLRNWLQGGGIHPRKSDGLDGVVWAPLLHADWGHLASNSIPFVAMGGLVGIRGTKRLLQVTIAVVLIGGGLTWLFAGKGNHIGASGVVFGYFGALVGAALFERRPSAIAPAMVALMIYSGILVGLVPQTGISWEGHLFGLLAGLAVSKTLAEPKEPHLDPEFDFPDSASEF